MGKATDLALQLRNPSVVGDDDLLSLVGEAYPSVSQRSLPSPHFSALDDMGDSRMADDSGHHNHCRCRFIYSPSCPDYNPVLLLLWVPRRWRGN